MFTADEKQCAQLRTLGTPMQKAYDFYLFNMDTNTVTKMNSSTNMDTGTVTETGIATSTVSETTTDTDMAMNTGTTTETDTDMVMNTETHIDTDTDIGMVMHGHQGRRHGVGKVGKRPPWKKIGWALPTLEICLTDHFDGPF